MQVISHDLVVGKKVILRLDIDVPLKSTQISPVKMVVADDFRLKAGMATLELCLQYAESVTVIGHVGRPEGEDPKLSVGPIVDWLEKRLEHHHFPEGKLHVMENLRYEVGEEESSVDFAKEIISQVDPQNAGNVLFINEAFASHHVSASTTVLPTLLPHAAGLQFAKEVEELEKVRKNPKRPLTVIIGGVKLDDKLPAVEEMAKTADHVLVGGKIAVTIKQQELDGSMPMLPGNVYLAKLTDNGEDVDSSTIQEWEKIIHSSQMILWNGPLGKIEDPKNHESKAIALAITQSNAETIIGGGDTVHAITMWQMLDKFSFVSTGGGAMLEYLVKGTLETIQVLEN